MKESVQNLPIGMLVMCLRGALEYGTKEKQFPLICEFKKRYKTLSKKKLSKRKKTFLKVSEHEVTHTWLSIGKASLEEYGVKL